MSPVIGQDGKSDADPKGCALMKLAIPILLNCVLVLAVYLTDRYTPFQKMPYIAKQIIIGLLFGGVSMFASSYGVELLGTTVNVRDAAPLTAGLVFGAPAGIISGFIGGLYRFFSVMWGAGEYTRLACTIATILAGFMAAGLRKLMFDDKKPTWGYGVCIAVVCEVIHMLLIFITNMDDSSYAFEFVKGATIPMIIGNSIAVGMAIVIASLLNHERLTRINSKKKISHTFQKWLLLCIVVAFLATSTFTHILQNGMVRIETQEVFTSAINDVKTDVREKSDDYMLTITKNIAKEYEESSSVSLDDLAVKYDVIEINVVSTDGIIIDSTQEGYVGEFNMKNTKQSREFMVLANSEGSIVQEYGPVGINSEILRKYAAVSLSGGGFIQVGYSTEQFHKMLDTFVIDVTKNRHVGSRGFVAVCDENLNLVTQDGYNGKNVSAIGINPEEELLGRRTATKLYEADIIDADSEYYEKYIYVFTFVEGYCIIAAMPVAEAMFLRDASLYTSVFMQVLIFATLFVFIYFLIKSVIINNIKKINTSLGQITNGNLNVTVDVRSNEEFASLSDDINSTVDTLKNYIAEAAARIDKELEYAKQIQLSALPAKFPEKEEFDIYAQMIAAKEVGGDFYDFYKIEDNKVVFLVADVSGKGIPAAMFMMRAKTIIKDLAESGMAANDIFTRANEKLCENNESGMFVTAWIGILNTKTGVLRYSNAGHNPPLLLHENGEFEYLRSSPGFVLAGIEGMRYKVNELRMSKGDRIFLYTDGVTEATNSNNMLYGEERLIQYMNSNKDKEGTALLQGLKSDIDLFVGEAPQFDDITMLIFDYKPENENIITEKRVFPACTDELDSVLGFIEDVLNNNDCPLKTTMAVCVAIEEVFVNIASYAYGDKEGEVEVEVSFDRNSRQAIFRMSDSGIPFNPLDNPDPDITLSAQERDIGGLGIFITKKTMDKVSYSYENGRNVLTMTKTI